MGIRWAWFGGEVAWCGEVGYGVGRRWGMVWGEGVWCGEKWHGVGRRGMV